MANAGRAVARVWLLSASITTWVGQAAIDEGKPLPGKDGLRSAEREELARLRREKRRLEMERDILARATAMVCRQRREEAHAVFELMMANQADFPVHTIKALPSAASVGRG